MSQIQNKRVQKSDKIDHQFSYDAQIEMRTENKFD